MSNDKVLPENGSNNKPSRKGRLNIGLERKIPTERYGNLVIHHYIDEEIEWQTLPERHKKVANWYTVLTSEFKELHDSVLKELGLSQKRAYFESSNQGPQPGATTEVDNLDDLDSLD